MRRVRRGAGQSDFAAMNLPNLLTIARILLAPFIIWLIISGEMLAAFIAFLVAGVAAAVLPLPFPGPALVASVAAVLARLQLRRLRTEDGRFEAKFGEEYRRYKANVRRWL